MPHTRNGTKRAAARMGGTFQREVNRLSGDVENLKEDLSGIARDTLGVARAGMTEAKRGVKKSLNVAKDSGSAAAETLKDHVTSNPLTSLGVAAGLGLLLGAYFFRGRS
ncbi:MAG: DUF883 family protein [Phycisphaerae bacterium]|nr:DUF883 family protein [Phycisphaerae bacterium]